MPVQCTCAHCGKVFYRSRSTLAEGKGKYCSKSCMNTARAAVHVPCAGCGTLVYKSPGHRMAGKTSYCSHRCWADTTRLPPEDRFWAKVARVLDPEVCWLWTAHTGTGGYGQFSPAYRVSPQRTHIYAWRLVGSPIPEGWWVCHTCDVPACVRNDDVGVYEVDGVEYERHGHLFLAPPEANKRDMVLKGRAQGRYPRKTSGPHVPAPAML